MPADEMGAPFFGHSDEQPLDTITPGVSLTPTPARKVCTLKIRMPSDQRCRSFGFAASSATSQSATLATRRAFSVVDCSARLFP